MATAELPAIGETGLGSKTKAYVLIVDDLRVNQLRTAELIEKLGWTSSAVSNGQEALDYLSAHPRPDVILMKLSLPVMSGFAATTAIRANPTLAAIPIIAMTVGDIPPIRDQCLSNGMDDVLFKPIKMATLHASLQKWVKKSDFSHQ